ncbi:hypothetical protein RJ640_023606 [Escallonia rubra]|uniref:Cytochrome P450 n=1 Tax=Escallonia rubra TaxID=112253 RepID=A0AA88R067_9ASTE|nr:hypothetical protein RJ640_023606 [Escallonia rubra]
MKYSWNVANEALRLIPPGIGAFREVAKSFTYGRFMFPKGMKMHNWITPATNKNPQYHPDPEKFDPTRFDGRGPVPFAFVPFGGGPRIWPGNEYARVAVLVFMHHSGDKVQMGNGDP